MLEYSMKGSIPCIRNSYVDYDLGSAMRRVEGSDAIVRIPFGSRFSYLDGDVSMSKAQLWKGLFDELTGYGISVVPFHVFLGQDDQRSARIMAITKHIYGTNIADATFQPSRNYRNQFTEQLDAIGEGLIKYMQDKKRNKDIRLTDIFRLDQFMYGSLLPDGEPDIWLVDIDPIYFDINRARNVEFPYTYDVARMKEFIKDAQVRWQISLPTARHAYKALIQEFGE